MTESRYPGLEQANGEHRDGFAARYTSGYGYDSGEQPAVGGAATTSYDPAATQYSSPPEAYSRAADDAPGYDSEASPTVAGYEGYDLTKIGGTATYGSPTAAGSAATGVESPGADQTGTTSYGSSTVTSAAGSTYRVGRDGSVKKLGVDTQTGLPPVPPSSVPRSPTSPSSRTPRRARLQLKHIDPWSMMKFSLVMSVALFLVWMIAVGVLYGVLSGMGVFDKVNSLYDQVHGGNLLSGSFVLGSAAVIGAINIVLMTALATVGAFVYNLCSELVGGIEVTLAERD